MAVTECLEIKRHWDFIQSNVDAHQRISSHISSSSLLLVKYSDLIPAGNTQENHLCFSSVGLTHLAGLALQKQVKHFNPKCKSVFFLQKRRKCSGPHEIVQILVLFLKVLVSLRSHCSQSKEVEQLPKKPPRSQLLAILHVLCYFVPTSLLHIAQLDYSGVKIPQREKNQLHLFCFPLCGASSMFLPEWPVGINI